MKILLFLALAALVVAGAVGIVYFRADAGKRRFYRHLAKQVKYLPGRYYS